MHGRTLVLAALAPLALLGCNKAADESAVGATGATGATSAGLNTGDQTAEGLSAPTAGLDAGPAGDDATDGPAMTSDGDATTGPEPTGPEPFSFVLFGDSRAGGGCDSNTQHLQLIDLAAADESWAFAINLGDMVAGFDSSTCWVSSGSCEAAESNGNFSLITEVLRNRPAPAGLPTSYFPVVGNHDDNFGWYPDPCGGRMCDVFDLPALVNHPTRNPDPCTREYLTETYYSWRYQSTVFIALRVNFDSFDFFECNQPNCQEYCLGLQGEERYAECRNLAQYDWLAQTLADASSDATVDNIIVAMHAPIYTSFEDHPPPPAATALSVLFDQHGVDYSFNGHNHVYERTVPIMDGVEDSQGTVYITSGKAGSDGSLAAGDWFTAATSDAYHYTIVHVDGPQITGSAIDVTGAVIDEF